MQLGGSVFYLIGLVTFGLRKKTKLVGLVVSTRKFRAPPPRPLQIGPNDTRSPGFLRFPPHLQQFSVALFPNRILSVLFISILYYTFLQQINFFVSDFFVDEYLLFSTFLFDLEPHFIIFFAQLFSI